MTTNIAPKVAVLLALAMAVFTGGLQIAVANQMLKNFKWAIPYLWSIAGLLVVCAAVLAFLSRNHGDTGWFAFEASGQAHPHLPFEFFIRNCGPRFVRNVRFDPVESRHSLKIWFNSIASLAPGERSRVGYRAGENGEYLGVTGHVISFFEGGSDATNQPLYRLTAHFLDGDTERTEEHMLEGHPLPKGGITFKVYPAVAGLASFGSSGS